MLSISRSKLDPHQDDFFFVRVINSSHTGFSSWVTANYETLVVIVLSSYFITVVIMRTVCHIKVTEM